MQINLLSGPYVLTADIGGSHITAAVCDISTNNIIPGSLVRTELSSKGSAASILNTWETAFQKAVKSSGLPVKVLTIAMPGPFDYDEGISYITGLNKYEALYGMNIRQYLAGKLQINPLLIRFRNDAEATIAGEVLAGAGKDISNVMGVTLGTGFGSAFSANGITRDLNLGSEPFAGSIADDHLSTRWFLKCYNELTGMSVPGVKELVLLTNESKNARQVFKEFAVNMANFLSNPLQQLQPDVLIICGNIAKAASLFLPYLQKQLYSTNIKLGQLGENAALIGAAGLFDPSEISSSDNAQTITTLI